MTENKAPPKLIIFTDLDGTLLDHHTYSYKAAQPALDLISKHRIPLILASSKTAAEIIELRKELGVEWCEAIVENGAGILPPHAAANVASEKYAKLLQALNQVPSNLRGHFVGFSDLTDTEVAQITGLSLHTAKLARKRQFSEPGLWHGSQSEFEEFKAALETKNVAVQFGGRFATLSFGSNKADRVVELTQQYSDGSSDLYTIALGDSLNDIGMLNSVNLGIIIANPDGNPIPDFDPNPKTTILRPYSNGPKGWNGAVIDALNKQGLT